MFTHLHSHTEASIADGLFSPKKWVEAIKDRGFKAHAVTDHGVMTSLLPFYYLMKDEGLIPIMGAEFYYVDEPTDKSKENRKSNHIVLIAKDYDGFQNLLTLSKLSFTEGFYFRPRIGRKWISQYSEGLICLSACQGGILSAEVWNEEAGASSIGLEAKYDLFHSIFGDDFYVEFQGHAQEGQEKVNRAFYDRLREREGFKPVITNDCHYVLPEHAEIQTLLKDMAYRSKNSEAGQSYTTCDSLWLKKPADIWRTFKEAHGYLPNKFIVDGMANTEEIVDKVANFEIPADKKYLPTFRPKHDSKTVFRTLTAGALKKHLDKGVSNKEAYVERFKKEYAVICKYNLQDYFLIVWDLVRFARSKGIYTGIGRGSAAGCLISYLLGIVRVDPIEYGLIFERFLNAHRCEDGELPDIDLDFESDRRNEIKEYIFETYGRDKVCEIGTYGRMQLKTSIIDFGKAYGVASNKELLAITTKLDLGKTEEKSLEAAVEMSPQLRDYMSRNIDYAFAVDEIIGQIKSQSIHPAGMVICSDPIHTITPLKTQKEKGGDSNKDRRVITTQAEDKYIIRQGLMKMDILGLKEYDIIKYVIEASGMDLTFDNYLDEILSDEEMAPRVWEMFQQGKSEGVFQFSSPGMMQLLKMIVPASIKDLMAANALYRPGCLNNGWHLDYCKRKHGEAEIDCIHPDLEETLGETYGVCVYQEQFMEVIHRLGGISLVDSDIIRSALGKKDEEKLNKFKERFVRGASKKLGARKAEGVWSQLHKASDYVFNKCVSGDTVLLRDKGRYRTLSVGEMFEERRIGRSPVGKKYRRIGFGKAYSMRDGRLYPNNIVDIRYEGERSVYRVIVESGASIKVTDNHKFPTLDGRKELKHLVVGDELYVNAGYEIADSTHRYGSDVSNLPKPGERGFQTLGETSFKLYRERSGILKNLLDHCQECGNRLARKEIHHLDGDHGNQDWDNIRLVCPSCHKKAHYKMGRRKKGEKGLLVRLEKIKSIELVGAEGVYDVEMGAPAHNFATEDGIVTANSHSAAYSVLAYISQYLKISKPEYFWAAQLEWDTRKGKHDEMLRHKKAALEMGVHSIFPEINKSKSHFLVDGPNPVWSFCGIKGLGPKAAYEVERHQPYADFEDFYTRVHKNKCRFNNIASLIYSGAFDAMGDRRALIKSLYGRKKDKETPPKLTDEHMMMQFYENMGFFEQKIKKIKPGFEGCIIQEELEDMVDGESGSVGGMLIDMRRIKTKSGDPMGFGSLVDLDERIEVTFFPRSWAKYKSLLSVGKILRVDGVKAAYNGKNNLISAEAVIEI